MQLCGHKGEQQLCHIQKHSLLITKGQFIQQTKHRIINPSLNGEKMGHWVMDPQIFKSF